MGSQNRTSNPIKCSATLSKSFWHMVTSYLPNSVILLVVGLCPYAHYPFTMSKNALIFPLGKSLGSLYSWPKVNWPSHSELPPIHGGWRQVNEKHSSPFEWWVGVGLIPLFMGLIFLFVESCPLYFLATLNSHGPQHPLKESNILTRVESIISYHSSNSTYLNLVSCFPRYP